MDPDRANGARDVLDRAGRCDGGQRVLAGCGGALAAPRAAWRVQSSSCHVTTNNALQYIPGSHTWSTQDDGAPCVLPITGLAGDMQAITQTLTPSQRDALAHPTAIPLKAGYASFHHPLLVHGSFANCSSSCRRATVINLVKCARTPLARNAQSPSTQNVITQPSFHPAIEVIYKF